jgi:hypothetical protein
MTNKIRIKGPPTEAAKKTALELVASGAALENTQRVGRASVRLATHRARLPITVTFLHHVLRGMEAVVHGSELSDGPANIDQGRIVYYRANKNDCSACSLKLKCTTAAMRKVSRLSADTGSYALSGQHAAFTVSLAGGAGSYAPTGNDAG